jgi:hypothetical protein
MTPTTKYLLTRTLLTADVPARNGRVYPLAAMQKAVEAVQAKVAERRMLGTMADGPEQMRLEDATHIVTELRWEGPRLVATIEFLHTPTGKGLLRLMEATYDDRTTYAAHSELVLEGEGTVAADGLTVATMEIRSVAVRVPRHISSVREENTELNALFDRQHERVMDATRLWREETGQHEVLPDLGDLVKWLMDRYAEVKAENAKLKERL